VRNSEFISEMSALSSRFDLLRGRFPIIFRAAALAFWRNDQSGSIPDLS
jgi:hypothetical protein